MGLQELAEALIDKYVLIYIFIIVAAQLACWGRCFYKRKKIERQRRKAELPPDIIMDHSERLADLRKESIWASSVLVVTIFLTPFAIIFVIWLCKGAESEGFAKIAAENGDGLILAFIGLFIWILFSGTDVARNFLGGLGFKTLVAFKSPFQVGDRVTLKGIGGKVTSISTFFVTLQTPNDDLINIPTSGLWSEVLTSANAGERSSLCVMDFFLAPFVTQNELQDSEDTIWNAIQASPYLEVANPMQIFFTQNNNSIQLTAKAYVASTYNEALFKSEVTKAFLNFTAVNKIPLASMRNRVN